MITATRPNQFNRFDEQLSQTKDLTRTEFAKIVQENRQDFQEAIDIIVQDNKSDEFVAKVMPIIEHAIV